MSAILRFYGGQGADAQGRSLAEILGWDDARLEAVHDYIQWLFPLPEPSGFNPDAPLLTPEDIRAFHAQAALRDAMRAAQHRMLRFYRLPPASGTPFRAPWLTPGNHNFLRLTRILRSSTLLGLQAEARAILESLEVVASNSSNVVSARTLAFWREATQQKAATSAARSSQR